MNGIFVAATGQNVGKTTLCLGIFAALQKRFPSVGFIKPMGQQHVNVGPGINVDKDVLLIKEHFGLTSHYPDMSPVIVPSGFTRQFLDGSVTEEELLQNIRRAYKTISSQHAFTLVEGTGHVGVGSILNLNNARIAKELGLDMIIIASGGLGSACDELSLNLAMCARYGVKVQGVILNRVLDEKREMILNYFPKSLESWGVPLLGCVPYNEFLNTPTIKDFAIHFNTHLLSGQSNRYRHFRHSRLVAGSLESYLKEIVPNELIITPASRDDIIMAALQQKELEGGMILTGRQPPKAEILEEIAKSNIPSLYVPLCSYDAMKHITSFIAKIRAHDVAKVNKAIELVEQYVDFNLVCQIANCPIPLCALSSSKPLP